MIKLNATSIFLVLNTTYILILMIVYSSYSLRSYASFYPIAVSLVLCLTLWDKLLDFKFKMHNLALFVTLASSCIVGLFIQPYVSIDVQIKFFLIFYFFFLGVVIGHEAISEWYLIIPFILLPSASLAIFLYESILTGDSDGNVFFFSNRNNAVAYFLASVFVLRAFNYQSKFIFPLIFVVVFLFSTLGAILAILISFMVVYSSYNPIKLLVTLFSLITVVFIFSLFDFPIFQRIFDLQHGIFFIFSQLSLHEVANLSYGEIVHLNGGNTDLSLFFRLKQWLEIYYLVISEPMYILFGWGGDATVSLTSSGLVAHNDWLRIFFELGVINFVCFLILNIYTCVKLYRCDKFGCFLFLSFICYMLGENIFTNYLTCSFIYFFAGVYINNENSKRRT